MPRIWDFKITEEKKTICDKKKEKKSEIHRVHDLSEFFSKADFTPQPVAIDYSTVHVYNVTNDPFIDHCKILSKLVKILKL